MKIIFLLILMFSFNSLASKVHVHQEEASEAWHEIKSLLGKASTLEKNLVDYQNNISLLKNEIREKQQELDQAIYEINSDQYCRYCRRTKSDYERTREIHEEKDFITHQRKHEHLPPFPESLRNEWNNKLRPVIERAKEKVAQLKKDYDLRNDYLWKTLKVRDRKLYPAYRGTFKEVVIEYKDLLEKMKKRIKIQEELIEQYDEILMSISEEDPEFNEFLQMLSSEIQTIYQNADKIYDRQIRAVENIELHYSSYSLFNISIQNIASKMSKDSDLGTTGHFIHGNFHIPNLGVLMEHPMPSRPPSFNGLISTTTLKIIKKWSGKI